MVDVKNIHHNNVYVCLFNVRIEKIVWMNDGDK